MSQVTTTARCVKPFPPMGLNVGDEVEVSYAYQGEETEYNMDNGIALLTSEIFWEFFTINETPVNETPVNEDVGNRYLRFSVSSSNIDYINYNEKHQEAIIDFKGGTSYLYKNVTREEIDEMVDAESVGSHFNRVFKAAHPDFEKIEKPKVSIIRIEGAVEACPFSECEGKFHGTIHVYFNAPDGATHPSKDPTFLDSLKKQMESDGFRGIDGMQLHPENMQTSEYVSVDMGDELAVFWKQTIEDN